MWDKKYMFGDKSTLVQAIIVKTCSKKVKKKKYFFVL